MRSIWVRVNDGVWAGDNALNSLMPDKINGYALGLEGLRSQHGIIRYPLERDADFLRVEVDGGDIKIIWEEPTPDRATLHRLISNDAIDPNGTGVWSHAQTHARDAAAAVYAALTGMGNETALEQDLRRFLLRLKNELAANGNPFLEEQLTAIDGFLEEAGFEWRVGDLLAGGSSIEN